MRLAETTKAATSSRQLVEVPDFKDDAARLQFWRRKSVSHRVANSQGMYTFSRKEAKEAFRYKKVDLIEKREPRDDRVAEGYRGYKLRDAYEAHREAVQQLNVRLHPWLHWGTEA